MSEGLSPEIFTGRKLTVALAASAVLLTGCNSAPDGTEPVVESIGVASTLEVPPTTIIISNPQPVREFMLKTATPKLEVINNQAAFPRCIRVDTQPAPVFATDSLASFVSHYEPLASRVQQACGVPIEVALAQAFHESNGGRSELSRQHKNMFGIKAKPGAFGAWNGRVTVQKTQEHYTQAELDKNPPCAVDAQPLKSGKFLVTICAAFRAYDSPEESFMDYGYYLQNRGMTARGEFYADAFREKDPIKFLGAITDDDDGPAGPQKSYATDGAYVEKVSNYIRQIQKLKNVPR